jgi:hypothetical protein
MRWLNIFLLVSLSGVGFHHHFYLLLGYNLKTYLSKQFLVSYHRDLLVLFVIFFKLQQY